MEYEELERSGNKHFVTGNYAEAIEVYTRALRMKPDNPIMLCNRAQAYINLNRNEQGLQDANAALKLTSGQERKALYRSAKALYGLARYEEALEQLEKLLQLPAPAKAQLPPTNAAVRDFAAHVKRSLEEKLNGKYDTMSMVDQAETLTMPYLDHAEYIGPVRVAKVLGKGKGLVATKKIAAGTLILCCKAYEIVFDQLSDRDGDLDEKCRKRLLVKVVKKLQQEPNTAGELYSLYAGSDMPSVDTSISTSRTHAAERLEIDINRIHHIVTHCAFGTSSTSLCRGSKLVSKCSLGLWILPSFINHSCLANARHSCIGNFLFVRAISDITEGEEISISYVEPLESFEKRSEFLEFRSFRCHCALCSFARERPDVASIRAGLIQKYEQVHARIQMNYYTGLPELKEIISEFRNTYEFRSTLDPMPLELLHPLMNLAHLYIINGHLDRAVSPLVELFDRFPRLDGKFSNVRTDIAWRLRCIYMAMGQCLEMRKWEKKAREEFQVYSGKQEGLWQNYLESRIPPPLRKLMMPQV